MTSIRIGRKHVLLVCYVPSFLTFPEAEDEGMGSRKH